MDLRILLLPFGVILGSLAGGALCTALNPFSLGANLAVSAGMGWYSLSGVLLGEALGADIGAVSFLSNLIREFLSFLLIPLAVKTLNSYAAIALAGATSEDTALPVLIRHAPEDRGVLRAQRGSYQRRRAGAQPVVYCFGGWLSHFFLPSVVLSIIKFVAFVF